VEDPRGSAQASDADVAKPANAVAVVEPGLMPTSADAVHLNSCSPLETLVVNTRSSVYELIVLQGERGEVFVRGGKLLPEFRRARFVGSTTGGTALKLNTIDLGLRMEFNLGGQIMVTSAVHAISRQRPDVDPEVEATRVNFPY
jgi:hypothetical protein